jgi:carbon-monoxide dehydrogenase medium subunit
VLTALDASVTLRSTTGTRMVLVADLITGAYTTTLAAGEILTAVHIPQCAGPVAWGYVKACRKPGEFAHAMAAVLIAGGTRRLVIGATGGAPLLLTGDQASLEGAAEALADLDPVDRRMQSVVVHRALQQADVCATSL